MANTCIVVADRARARFLIAEKPPEHRPGNGLRLREIEAFTNPEGELTGNELFSNTRSGKNRAPSGAEYEFDDHRERHRDEIERRFARQLARSIVEFARRESAQKLVLAAEPRMLGMLRVELGGTIPKDIVLLEYAENLSSHTPDRIEEALGRHGAWQPLPPR